MNSTEEQRKVWRERSRRDYSKYRKARLKKMKERRAKLRAWIIRQLGGKCIVCGATEPLSIHHLQYHSRTREPTLKSLKAGELVLLCRKHHRAIHYVNELIRAGHLEKILNLVNKERSPWYT